MSEQPVRVLHCIESIGSGGVEQRRLSLAKYLPRDRFQQAMVCAKVKGDFDKRLNAYGTEVHAIGPLGRLSNRDYYKKLFKVIKAYRPEIIHGAVFEGVISAVVGGLFYRIPLIVVEETSDPIHRSWRGNLLFKLLARFADTVVATSPAVFTYLTGKLKLRKDKVRLIMNGVDPPAEPNTADVEAWRQKLGLQKTDFVIGSVGRMFDHIKKFSLLIKSVAELSGQYPSIKLLLVGDGPDRAKLEQMAADLGVSRQVVFAGYQSDPRCFYKLMDVFALVSATEGFGIAAVEAMFFKVPVLGTRVGGIKDIVVDGETGVLVDNGDGAGIRGAIGQMFGNREQLGRMSEAGYRRAHDVFTAERYARDVQELYQQLLNNRS